MLRHIAKGTRLSSAANSFTFCTFAPNGEGRVSMKVSEKLLSSQEHTAATRESIDGCFAGDTPAWRLHLKVENTQSLDVDFAQIGKAAAVVRILRGDIHAILVLVADAAGDADSKVMRAVHDAIRKLAGGADVTGAFEWITGTPPPLAGLLYLTGEASNGVDMLGMCLASGFFGRALR